MGQKRLGKGQKYFDSGDYQMAKQGGRLGRGPIPVLAQPTGEEHPTPDSVPARKSSIIQGTTNTAGAPPGHPVGQTLPRLDYCDQRFCSAWGLSEDQPRKILSHIIQYLLLKSFYVRNLLNVIR